MTTDIKTTVNDVDLAAVGALAQAIQETPEKGQTVWNAEVTWKGAFLSEVKIRDFDPIPSDEPPSLGGTDTAPNPVEQLLGALGNCLAVGYAANASAAGITINDLRINLSGDLDLHTFLGLKPGHAGYDRVSVEVHLDTDATDEQIAELHSKVTETSPVGDTFSNRVPVRIELAK
jgi:uncharacterized OsmC-like protein